MDFFPTFVDDFAITTSIQLFSSKAHRFRRGQRRVVIWFVVSIGGGSKYVKLST
jgi:hypothetical protein